MLCVACSQPSGPPTVTVFAASSLVDVLPPLAERFERESGIAVRFHFASSLSLVNQVKREAPADLLISASPNAVELLGDRVRSSRTVATNQLVLVGRPGEAPEGPWMGILGKDSSRLAIGDPKTVPAGQYAREALEHLELWEPLEPRLVFALNVRAALALVRAGNVEVAVVYASDVLGVEQEVKVLYEFPPDSHAPIEYPALVLTGEAEDEAGRFAEYLLSPDAQEAFREAGFEAP